MADQRLPIVNSDDGIWGDILRQYLMKEHFNDDTNNPANGGHQFVTIRAGTTSAAPLTLTSGSLLSTPAIGAIEFNNDTLYFTKTTGATRMQLVADTATQTLANKTLTSPKISQINDANGNEALILGTTASAVNEISITNAATTVSPSIAASGNDTNISIELTPKGTGRVKSGGVIIPTISSADTLTNKTLTNPTVNNYTEGTVAIGTVTTAATISLTNGTVQTATLTASTACTFTMPTAAAGKSFVLFLKQAASTGLGTATFTGVKWPGGTAPTITPTAGQMDILTFTSDGTNWYGTFIQGFTP